MDFEKELQLLLQRYPEIESVTYDMKTQKVVKRPLASAVNAIAIDAIPPARIDGEVAPGVMETALPENPDDMIAALKKRAGIVTISE